MNSDKRKIGSAVIIVIFFELVVIIGLIVGVVGRIRENSEIEKNEEALYNLEITNFRQVFKDISRNNMKDIVFSVHDIVWLNTDNISKKVGATIREDSVTQTFYKNDGVYKVSFLVDIPNLNQTYNVVHYYSESIYNEKIPSSFRTIVYCVEGNANCKDRYGGKVKTILDKMEYK